MSISLSPAHSVPMDTAITGTVTLNDLEVDSYSSVIFRADITPYNRAERRCNGDDTGRDIEIPVDESSEVFTVRIFDACPGSYHSYGSYTLSVSISKGDISQPGDRVELASARTQFSMSRYLAIGVPTATPPSPGALAWMDPDPRNLNMKVHGNWRLFKFRSNVRRYLNDHMGAFLNAGQPGHFATGHPGKSPEDACRDSEDRDEHWRRAINQGLWVVACKPGAATIQLRHETDGVAPLYTYNFRTLSNESTPTPTPTVMSTATSELTPTPTPEPAIRATPTYSPTPMPTAVSRNDDGPDYDEEPNDDWHLFKWKRYRDDR